MKHRCDVYERKNYQCRREAHWKVPMYAFDGPYLVCDVHVKDWRESQPKNVKPLNDDTPWVNKKTGYNRDSRLSARASRVSGG
jgi:hypothetical protein